MFLHETAEFCAIFSRNILKHFIIPSKFIKPKRMALTLTQKLEVVGKLEKGACFASVCEEYGVAKQTVSPIRKSIDKKLYIFLRTFISFYLHYIICNPDFFITLVNSKMLRYQKAIISLCFWCAEPQSAVRFLLSRLQIEIQ